MRSYQKPQGYRTLKETASHLQVGHHKLISLLKEKGVLTADRLPRVQFVHQGYFCMAQGHYTLPGTGIERGHVATLVTPVGLPFVEDLAKELPRKKAPARQYH